ncbi:TMV resistance protein N [Vitis vinifera]|uniref:TMV resistance protein N n=1 Tax=Vitis vinifera TaxID=29760 RepID=A0A438IJN1_VITVI|nr:TMV resistance protein N [Vitis vinifera]
MASSSTHRASSSTTSISRNYDVFLSFRGGDTRKNFTDHLYTTLTASGIQTFRDDEELEKGGDIASDLLRAIEESRGSFGDALAYHERDANQEKEMIQKWRIALREAANLSGCHVNDQYETEVVKEIVDTIIRRLNHQPLSMGKNIVGIGVHLEKLKSLMNTELNMVSVVGIYGIGGVGKTTIAKAIYNEISHQYDGISMIKRCLSSNRVLVIFDDVDELKQLEYLAEEKDWFRAKSTIIITSRDKHVLAQYGADIRYELHDKLRVIDLSYSVHLIRIPDFSSVPNLEILTLEGCVNLELLPRGIYKWKRLQTLSCNGSIMDLPSSITHLNGLQTLLLEECSKLHKIPSHICHLSSLKVLDLGHCNIMEGGIPSDICHLSSLQKLNLERGHFGSIPTTINQLSRLEILNLSHCSNLEQIPELPSRLRLLDAHGSNRISSRAPFLPLHSLVNCFSWARVLKSTSFSDSSYHGKGTCIVLPGRHTQKGICTWAENESDNKSENESTHTWENETDDKSVAESSHIPCFRFNCFCYKEDKDEDNESVSGQTWVVCYSKAAIPERFHSCQWTGITTRFDDVYINSEKDLTVKKCGVRLIYSQDLQQSHPLTTQTEGEDLEYAFIAKGMGRFDGNGVLRAVT